MSVLLQSAVPRCAPKVPFRRHTQHPFTMARLPPAHHSRKPSLRSPSHRNASHVVRSAPAGLSAISTTPVSTSAELAQVPSAGGVYAIYSDDGTLQYIGISRKMSVSIMGHAQDVPELTHSVKFATLEDDSRENLTKVWKEWIEEAVTLTGDIPPGNAPGETKWRAKARQARPEIKLTAGKEIVGVTIEQLVDQVVKTNSVVAFIKGTRTAPQCGFSAKLVGILNDSQVVYDVVNVLDDHHNPGLREAIKVYSQWPTIPQLYVKGEFVGGSDIVEQMNTSGELKQLLSAK